MRLQVGEGARAAGPGEATPEGDAALAAFSDWQPEAAPAAGQPTHHLSSRLRLSGMHCAACAGLIESLLIRQPGVRAARVSAATQRLTLDWQPAEVTLDHLRRELRRAGYDCAPDLPAPAQELRRREHRQAIWRLFVAGFLMMQVMMLAWPAYVAAPGEMTPDVQALLRWGQWVMTLPVMLLAAGPFFKAAWGQLRAGRLGMDVPVVLGITVAFVAGTGATLDPGGPFGHEVYFDSVTMFVAFLLGARYLELRARHRAAEALEAVTEAVPDRVERLRADGGSDWVAAEALVPGDRVRVLAGQRIPADAVVTQGTGAVDESLLSGESRPVARQPGDAVLAGSVNLHGQFMLEVRHVGSSTRLAGLQRLMEQAFQERPALLQASDRMASVFLVGVLALALGAALCWQFIDPSRALAVAVSVLIVTCPCALSLAAPAAWVAAAGRMAKYGLLLSRLDAIESLARTTHVVMDKTGTLTDARLTLAAQWPEQLPDTDVAQAFAMAAASHHPMSRALLLALQALRPGLPVASSPQAPPAIIEDLHEHAGRGLETVDAAGHRWRLGAPAWAAAGAVALPGAQLVLARDGLCLGAWRFDEQLRADAGQAVAACRAQGLTVELLSGDQPERVAAAAQQAGIAHWHGGASPEDKLAHIVALQARGAQVLMLGDGINDAPVLARAQVSVAMGQGADLAKARADALLVQPRLEALPAAIALARKTGRVVRQNLAWALLYNASCVPLALIGWLPPWAAGLGMALSSALVVGNATRLGRH